MNSTSLFLIYILTLHLAYFFSFVKRGDCVSIEVLFHYLWSGRISVHCTIFVPLEGYRYCYRWPTGQTSILSQSNFFKLDEHVGLFHLNVEWYSRKRSNLSVL